MVIDIDAVMLMVYEYVNIYEYVINAPSTAHGARSAAATELRRSCALLRRSRCCDGYAQTSSVALILRVASS